MCIYIYNFIKRNYTLETVLMHEENEIFIFKFYVTIYGESIYHKNININNENQFATLHLQLIK